MAVYADFLYTLSHYLFQDLTNCCRITVLFKVLWEGFWIEFDDSFFLGIRGALPAHDTKA